jgi:hypothetical protein
MRARFLSLATVCAVLVSMPVALAAQDVGAVQDAGFGARSGVAMGGLSGLDGARGRPGLSIGPTFGFRVNRWLGVQAELLYTAWGAWLTNVTALQMTGDVFSQASFRYLQVPLLARLNVGALLHTPFSMVFYGGPHASAMLECRLSVTAPLAQRMPCGSAPASVPFSNMNTFALGTITGASVGGELFHLFALAADVRYQRGFDRYGPILGGFRNSVWAFEILVSGIGRGGSARYSDLPPVPPSIQGAHLSPTRGGPVKGVKM